MQSTSTPVHSASTIGSGLDGPHTKRHYETSTTTPVHTSSAAGSQLDGLQNYSIAYTSTTVQSTLSLNYVLAGSYTKQNNFRASVSTQVHSTSLVGFQLDGLLHTKRDSVIMSTSAPIHSSSSVASRYKVLNMKQNYSMASSTVGSQHDRSHAKQKSSLILTPINSTSAVGSDVDGLHSNKIILWRLLQLQFTVLCWRALSMTDSTLKNVIPWRLRQLQLTVLRQWALVLMDCTRREIIPFRNTWAHYFS